MEIRTIKAISILEKANKSIEEATSIDPENDFLDSADKLIKDAIIILKTDRYNKPNNKDCLICGNSFSGKEEREAFDGKNISALEYGALKSLIEAALTIRPGCNPYDDNTHNCDACAFEIRNWCGKLVLDDWVQALNNRMSDNKRRNNYAREN